MEGEETGHADGDGSQNLVADVEVVMRKAAPLVREDAMVGILGGVLGHGDAERPSLFHALEHEVDTVSIPLLQAAQSGQDVIFFAYSLAGPFDGDMMVASVSFHPSPVIVGAPAEHFFVGHGDAEKLVGK